MVDIVVNGEARSVPERTTIADLLTSFEFPTAGVAVEVNRTIVPRRAHEERLLAAGDEVEIVTFVGGG